MTSSIVSHVVVGLLSGPLSEVEGKFCLFRAFVENKRFFFGFFFFFCLLLNRVSIVVFLHLRVEHTV